LAGIQGRQLRREIDTADGGAGFGNALHRRQ
jgi:hypothetical protein